MTVQSETLSVPIATTDTRKTRHGSQEAMIGYSFILPAIIGFVLFYTERSKLISGDHS